MRRTCSRGLSLALLALLATGACGVGEEARSPGSPSTAREERTILYLAPGPENDPTYLPAYRGAQVAAALAEIRGHPVSVVWVDVSDVGPGVLPGDAAIVAPGTPARVIAALVGVLDVPVVSLAGSGAPTWWVLGPARRDLRAALLGLAGERPCSVLADATWPLRPSSGAMERVTLDAALADPASLDGCSAILWTGDPEGAAQLRLALAGARLRGIPFIGTDLLRDGSFEQASGAVGRGTLVVSGAADVVTRLDLRSRRFVQLYQEEVGLAPGPFSAEGFDAAHILFDAIDGGAWPIDRLGISGQLSRRDQGPVAVTVYRLGAARWLPVG